MGKEKNDFVKLCAYLALVLAALLIFVNNVLPIIGLNLEGKLMGILVLVKEIALLLGICFAAYAFAANKGKAWRIIYWIALIVYLASAVFGVI